MYLGRIVAAGLTKDGRAAALYRVSSRSFPNREGVGFPDGRAAIVPKAGHEDDLRRNPYIAYNCMRMAGDYAVVTNGSHTDPIAENIAKGMPVRDALVLSLTALDFEHDSLDTPRIAAVIAKNGTSCFLGIVRRDAVLVREMKLTPGQAFYISTYEHNYPCEQFCDSDFDCADAMSGCRRMMGEGVFAEFTNAVGSVAAVAKADGSGFETAVFNG